MKKLIFVSLVVVFLLVPIAAPAATDGDYVRLEIPQGEVSTAIQPLGWLGDHWEEPNHVNAWVLGGFPNVIYGHRGGVGAGFARLRPGDLAYLYRTYDFEDEPLQLQVFETEVIPVAGEPAVWDETEGSDVFALVTCHPPEDLAAPERLVVWAKVDHGPRWVYVDWGDTLSLIAQRYGVSVEAIVEENNIANPNLIRAGIWLSIP